MFNLPKNMASVLLNKKITYADLEEDEGLKIELKKSRTYLVIHKVNLWPRSECLEAG